MMVTSVQFHRTSEGSGHVHLNEWGCGCMDESLYMYSYFSTLVHDCHKL